MCSPQPHALRAFIRCPFASPFPLHEMCAGLTLSECERQVLASLLEVAPADRAAILLVEDNSTEFT